MLESEEKVNHLEEVRKRLYSRNEKLMRKLKQNPLRNVSYGVPTDWSKAKEKIVDKAGRFKLPPTFLKNFFIFSVVFFASAVLFFLFKFYTGSNTVSPQNIDISVLGNSFVAGGEELSLQVEIVNKNSTALELSDLLIEYPKGSSGEATGDYVRIRKSLGSISAGKTVNQNINVVLFGEQGTTKDIKVSLEYRVQDSNAIFVKDAKHAVNISSSPLSLSVDGPSSISSNQDIVLNAKILSTSLKVSQNILLKADYPPGFKFISSVPSPMQGDNVWDIGDLAQNAEKTISIKGTIYGQDQEEKSFHFYVGEKDSKDQSSLGVVYNSMLHSISIARPFIEARLLINNLDQDEYAVPGGSPISAQVRWVNNLPTRVDDLQIKVRLTGNALDKRSINVISGFYNSLDDTITFDKNTEGRFSSVEPGETGTLSFSFSGNSILGDSGRTIAEPMINAEISIKASQLTAGNASNEINNSERKIIRINSNLQIDAKALYYSGPIQNSGPIPPKAEQKTTYTIVWTVANNGNGVSSAEIRASLPFYIRYAGTVSPPSEDISYNADSREVVWKLGGVPAGAGFSSDAKEVAFQVELQPSVSQIGSVPKLLSETALTAIDNFTNASLRSVKNALNTRFSSDPSFKSDDERVVE